MRKKHLKAKKQETPALLKRMGLDEQYQEFVKKCIEREKTHRKIWVKNPPHYKCKAYAVDIWNATEDLFSITAETMFGKKHTFFKWDLELEKEKK
jgi:hypothetical protein